MPFEMRMIYLGCAVVGGFFLVVQVLLALLGGDAEVEADADIDIIDGGSGVSIRTVVAFITFFGIGGMGSHTAGFSDSLTLLVAVLSGGVAFWLVGLAMLQLTRLKSSGNVDIENAVGKEGKIYLKVPAQRSGEGKVTVSVQGRSLETRAITAGPELPTGALCRIIRVHAHDTLEVEHLQ